MKYIPVLLLVSFLAGCAPSIYYVTPKEFTDPVLADSVIRSYEPFLKGRRIFLDPGHGGEDRRNRGPEGDVIEADVNLRVGLALREYLSKAGATVFMSRTGDQSISLVDRSALAIQAGAEMFISLHHNATGDDRTNYTSTYYHAYPGHQEYHPANHDLARYIQRDMSYAMRNASPPHSPTFDGTLSDFNIFPNGGFAVLRHNSLPSVLVEGSFFSHPYEEQRLAREEFNRIEAWGIFVGVGRYFRAGVPQLSFLSDTMSDSSKPTIVVGVNSTPEINPTTIHATINGKRASTSYDDSSKSITLTPSEELTTGTHELSVWVRNTNGNTSWPFKRRLVISLPVDSVSIAFHPDRLPLLNSALARVTYTVLDKNGMPVIDGTAITCRILETGFDTVLHTLNGSASFYIGGSSKREVRTFEASSGGVSVTKVLGFSSEPATFLSGVVSVFPDSTPVGGAEVFVSLADSSYLLDTTWPDGRYIVFRALPDSLPLLITHPGYYSFIEKFTHATEPLEVNAALAPVAEGRLFGKTFVIDPRYGGEETGDVSSSGLRASDINLAIGVRLHQLLRAAGANAHLSRISDTTISESVRAKSSSGYPSGMYVRLDASGKERQASAQIYMNIPNARFARHLLGGLITSASLDTTGVSGSNNRFYYDVAMGTITMVVPSVKTGFFDSVQEKRIDEIAWGLFLGCLRSEGFLPETFATYEVREETTQNLIPYARVIAGEIFSTLASEEGRLTFFGLEQKSTLFRVVGHPNATVLQTAEP